MTWIPVARRPLAVLLLFVASLAGAADQLVLGRKLLVKDPTGAESRRVVVIFGRSNPSSVSLVGNPTADGASLQVVANGASGSTQLLTLGAAGWTGTSNGFRYAGPTTGDPVRRVILRARPGGRAMVKALLRGTTGTADLVVTPPNPGDDGGLVLAIGGGDRYCVAFGGAAGGAESSDDAATWRIEGAPVLAGCPSSPSITTTSTSTTTSTTAELQCASSSPECGGACPANYHCEPLIGGCVCVTGGSDGCTVCDIPCTDGQVCFGALDPSNPPNYTATCECVTPPVCQTGTCGGSCPTGATCVLFPPGLQCSCYFVP